MATAKKTVTRRIPTAAIVASSVTPIKTLTKSDTKTKPSVPTFKVKIDYEGETSSVLEEVASILLSHQDFTRPEEDDSFEVKIINNETSRHFSFNLSGFPHCCGVTVLGGFTLHEEFGVKEASKILTDFVSDKAMKGHTIQITTAQSAHCLRMAKALEMSSRWQAVKTFKNQNSGNNVTIWVSNNE